ncbi:MAG: HAD-IA family hydrolase [Caldilineaceae bacterium]
MQPKAETVALMHELTELEATLYCLSNMPVERYAWLRQSYNFWPLFSGIIISGEIQLIKPDAAIYQHLLQKFELPAEACLFLDDSPPNIEAANALGIHGILFQDAADCRHQVFRLLND